MKTKNKEILVKFNNVRTPKELDEMMYTFEKSMNKFEHNYFIKESENPFIYFLESSSTDEIIKNIQYDKTLEEIVNIYPVTCVISNINYITSTILKKIKHKITYKDTFTLKCHLDTLNTLYNKKDVENDIKNRLKESIKISEDDKNPMWIIDIYIIGDITAINIKRSNKNRNKFSGYS